MHLFLAIFFGILKTSIYVGYWWCMSLIPAFRRISVSSRTAWSSRATCRTGSKATDKPCLKKQNETKKIQYPFCIFSLFNRFFPNKSFYHWLYLWSLCLLFFPSNSQGLSFASLCLLFFSCSAILLSCHSRLVSIFIKVACPIKITKLLHHEFPVYLSEFLYATG